MCKLFYYLSICGKTKEKLRLLAIIFSSAAIERGFVHEEILQFAQYGNFCDIITYAKKFFCFHYKPEMVHAIPLLYAATRQITTEFFPRHIEDSRGKPEKFFALFRCGKYFRSLIHWRQPV